MAKLREAKALRELYTVQVTECLDVARSSLTTPTLRNLFNCRYAHLEVIRDNFMTQHNNVIGLLSSQSEADYQAEDVIRKTFEQRYFECRDIHDRLFPPVDTPLNSERTSSSSNNGSSVQVRLPKLSLPTFGGNLAEWATFIDLFDTLIHNNDALQPIEKFQYLIMSLSGDPLSLVKSVATTADNYLGAYQALLDRYMNKRVLASAYWNAIDQAPKVMADSHIELRALLNIFTENLSALEQLRIDKWDFALFNCLLSKLNPGTRKQFELLQGLREIPTFEDLRKFVDQQCRALEASTTIEVQSPIADSFKRERNKLQGKSLSTSSPRRVNNVTVHTAEKCALCSQPHALFQCRIFKSKSPKERFNVAKSNALCINCLRNGHVSASCPSTHTCRTCQSRHHTLLHFDSPTRSNPNTSAGTNIPPPIVSHGTPSITSGLCANTAQHGGHVGQVLLATVQLSVFDKAGTPRRLRALVDTGSQISLINKKTAMRLGLHQSNATEVTISGIGEVPSTSCAVIQLQMTPIDKPSPILSTQAAVVSKICAPLPSSAVNPSEWDHIVDLPLADPDWNKPAPIDLLLGADLFSTILRSGIVSGARDVPIAVNTIFGWMIMGPVGAAPTRVQSLVTTFTPSLEETVKRFWELESVPETSIINPEHEAVKTYFRDTVYRNDQGRFGVALPFKGQIKPTFRGSQTIADKRWVRLEARLLLQPILYGMYLDFLRDYLAAGHMSLVTDAVPESCYFIPHHCVIKIEQGNPKIRVVFDASAKDADNHSLNDTLHIGPKLQADIAAILLRFRLRQYVLVCDIRQMYRQIMVQEEDRRYQYIRFRFAIDTPIHTYQLNTVTYGVSSAPFLAIYTLAYLVELESHSFPMAAQALSKDLYVDDCVVGRDSVAELRQLKTELIALLAKGGFELRKWASNNPDILADLPPEHLQTRPNAFETRFEASLRILGLSWDSHSDHFFFQVEPSSRKCTKRAILSQVAKIYDPLGLLAPISLLIKHLIQYLWKLGLDWDTAPPENVQALWHRLVDELPHLSKWKIPRYVLWPHAESCQLHAFCDASQKGYAAVVYLRCTHNNQSFTRLLISKSKVAPMNNKRIARLELCAATLLVKLVLFVQQSFETVLHIDSMFAWTDSLVALYWITSSPFRWGTYVANRVAFIQEKLPALNWRHVAGVNNPADAPSRGLFPDELLHHPSWLTGPEFLMSMDESWHQAPDTFPKPEASQSEEINLSLSCQISQSVLLDLINRCSSLQKVLRIVARIRRWYHNVKERVSPLIGPMTEPELQTALMIVVRDVQHVSFAADIVRLRRKELPSSQLRRLSPFLDENEVLRVGSRLAHANLPPETKHPALLPQRHPITELVIGDYHSRNCHAGILATIHLLRQQFWILSDRRAITRYIRNCVRCVRCRPKPLCPIMGNLPSVRVKQAKAFLRTGVDYAGPFSVTMLRKRGAKVFKAYVCLFVCCATKAIHIEIATDLTVDAFLAALRRFISRRGRCSELLSDCGTNFVGAKNELDRFMAASAEVERIKWSFNPPSAPHFGGLWESGVKSFKNHFLRVVGNQILSFEEFNTLSTQIEATLNSRPLTALSSDPNDLVPLTPGHFLTLEPLSAPPDTDLSHLSLSRLSRWQLVQAMHQEFWKRWHREYLHTLHQRSKWSFTNHAMEPKIGELVLIKDDNAPPLRWRTARIVELHRGSDGICRVATVLTSNGTIKRPLVKLCPLFTNEP